MDQQQGDSGDDATARSSGESTEGTPAPATKNTKGCALGCLGVVAAVVFAAVACSVSGGSGGDSWEPTAFEARSICEDWVREQLKAPSTAKFIDGLESGGPVKYDITGEVDAENSFGAPLRTAWTCSIEYRDSDEQWHGSAVLLD